MINKWELDLLNSVNEKQIKANVHPGDTADKQYKANRDAIDKAIKEIQNALTKMDKGQSKNNSSFVYGDTAHKVLELLNDILEFLG